MRGTNVRRSRTSRTYVMIKDSILNLEEDVSLTSLNIRFGTEKEDLEELQH